MKKIFIAAVLLLSVSTAFAQLDFGVKAGYTSSLSTTNLDLLKTGDYNVNSVNSELSNNFHAGVFARIGSGAIYIQPELLYAMGKKDYKVTMKDAVNNDVTYDKFVTISTVDVPLLIGYKLLDLKVANLRVFAGPKLRFNAGSSLEFENVKGGTITKDDLMKDIKAAQLGLEAGLGIDILKFTLDARYNLIGDMYQTQIKDLNIDKIPASTFVISLGWKLL